MKIIATFIGTKSSVNFEFQKEYELEITERPFSGETKISSVNFNKTYRSTRQFLKDWTNIKHK